MDIAIVNIITSSCRYCQKLPKDGYTTFVPEFIVDTINDKYAVCSIDPHTSYATLYFVTVQLPMNCPLKEPIKVMSIIIMDGFNLYYSALLCSLV